MQPHFADSIAWLKENIEGRRIKCELLKLDQYARVVALPLLPRTFSPWRHCRRWWTPQGGARATTTNPTTRNLPLEMIRAGWGVVYTQKGAVYGSGWDKETYLAAEAEAKSVLFFPISFSLFFSFLFVLSLRSSSSSSFFFYTNSGFVRFCPWFRAARRGIWQNGTNIELPADYKKRYRAAEVEAKVEGEGEGEDVERDERVSFWSRIFGRRKRARDSPS